MKKFVKVNDNGLELQRGSAEKKAANDIKGVKRNKQSAHADTANFIDSWHY